MWKKLVESKDIVSYEKSREDLRIIIEARYEDGSWEILKKYLGKEVDFVEQYYANSLPELKSLVGKLKTEKDLSVDEIKNINNFKKKRLKIDIRRAYKEKNVEKWFFSLTGIYANFIVVRYGDVIELDVVMNERYKYIEEKLIDKLIDSLGLDVLERDISHNIYYFTKKNSFFMENTSPELIINQIEPRV